MKSIVLPTGTEYVLFGELAHLIAGALYPLDDDATDSEMMAHGGARINLEAELNQAVKAGTLPVKDPLTFGPHSYPVGESLRRSLVKVDDLRAYLAGRPVTIEIAPAPDETAPVITFASFGKSAFMQLIRHEENRLMAHEVRADGVYVRAPDASDMRMGLIEPPAIHPTGDYDAPALPFPFTLAEFLAFEKTAGIVGQMHDDEIAALKDKTPMPYQLARAARYVEAGGNVNDLMQTPEPQAPPVGAESASGKRWTPERLDELRQYRTKHGTKNAAEHFGISAARVRELLPSGKPKATPFAGLIHRIN